MDYNTLYILLGITVFVVLYSLVVSVVLIRKQQHQETDDNVSKATVKHPFLLNPALIAYALFPMIIVVGAYLYYIYVIR